MVVVKLNRDCGRPESEKVDKLGVRKKERDGDEGVSIGRKGLCGGDRMVPFSFSGWYEGGGEEMLGRSRGFVLGVFWSLLFGRLGAGVDRGRCQEFRGDCGAEKAREERKEDIWLMGGIAWDKGDWDVGDARGENKVLQVELTYECLRSALAISCFSMSSWCTATLKRFQNCGSRTILMLMKSSVGGDVMWTWEGLSM
jgi:hypothetical protein